MTTPAPPAFALAHGRREKARAAGLSPDYWYPVEHERRIRRGQVVEVKFWNRSIALYRGDDGRLRALEDRCAHRQLKLSLGTVTGCRLACMYHGWAYDETGQLAEIPHDLFGHALPGVRVASYPVRARYGLVWIFPGDPALADRHPIPDIPELEGPDRWPFVPIDFVWRAHHSMIIENVSDFTHEWLHRKYRPFVNSKLLRCETVGDEVQMSYRSEVGRGKISGRFVDHRGIDTNAIELGFRYPYQWSNTGGRIKHWCFVLPIDERTSRAFFLFYFDAHRLPGTPVRLPRPVVRLLLAVSKRLLLRPLLSQDGAAVEAEQQAWDAHFREPVPDLNPAIAPMQQLIVRKWEEHLAPR
jgi:phenylpropionate dioxygenase-like ring-hydroxylating dioxygenase large terminal subunit